MHQYKTTSLALILLILAGACSSTTNPEEQNSFDRSAMLENYGNNIVLPTFENMQSKINQLQSTAQNFESERTLENLQTLQADLKNARLAWQQISPFQFGPSESVLLRASLNTYPADTEKIDQNISTGQYTLGTINSRDAAGLPALGYLLHGLGSTNAEILSMYTSDTNAENRVDYLLENITFIKESVDAATEDWQASGGDYIGMFLSEENAGTDVGSSLGMLINSYVMHYERFLRDGKIGIPAGIRSAGVARPTSVEAYYGGYSAELALANLEKMEELFTGGSGRGLDDNLQALNAGDLANEIQSEIDEAQAALEQLNDPLSQQIEENNEPVLTAFEELQKVVTLIKADMTSILGITITYQDNDGD